MTLTIPMWLLWGLGGVVALVVLLFAAFGIAMYLSFPTRFM